MRTRIAATHSPAGGAAPSPGDAVGELGTGASANPPSRSAIGADGHTSPDSVTMSAARSSIVASSDRSTSAGAVRRARQRRVRLHAVDHRVLVGLLGEVALRLLGQEELDQLRCLGELVGAGEHPGAGGHHQRAGAGVVEELVLGHGAALLGVEAQQVIVVDQAERYLPLSTAATIELLSG